MNAVSALVQTTVAPRVRRAQMWLLAATVAGAGVFFLAMHWFEQPPIPRADRRLEQASRLPASTSVLAWKNVSLPDTPADTSVAGYWYTLTFNTDDMKPALWAAYIEDVSAPLAFYVNGEFVGESHLVAPSLLPHARPFLIDFPSALLKRGANALQIRASLRDGKTFSPVYVAPDRELAPIYRHAYRVHITLIRVIALVSLLESLVFGILFLLRPRDRSYGWFSLSCFLWVLHALGWLIPDAALVNRPSWSFWSVALFGWSSGVSVMFIHSLLGVHARNLERVLWVVIALGSAFLLLPPIALGHDSETFARNFWIPGCTVVVVYTLWPLLRDNLRRATFEAQVLLAATLFVLAAGTHDAVAGARLDQAASVPYLNYAVNVMSAAIFATLMRRFVKALHEVDALNLDLEARVAQKARELEDSMARLKDIERERALSAERERIMRDMHDGLGGQLVAAIASVAQKPALLPIEETLRGLLEELRMIIDSLDPLEGDLASVLGTLRVRIEKKLQQAGTALVWRVDDVPSLPDLGPRHILHVMRIVQEAIANVIKHAAATSITLRTQTLTDTGCVAVEIIDDGCGVASVSSTGRGIANMQHRAREIGGALTVVRGSPGTTVRLLLPIQRISA